MLSFMDIIGPVCAQGKLDARKSKNFQYLDPVWRPKVMNDNSSLISSNNIYKLWSSWLLKSNTIPNIQYIFHNTVDNPCVNATHKLSIL